MTQKCFPGLRPSPPTVTRKSVARQIARRIVAAVNIDEFYWEKEELPERTEDVVHEIVRCGRPATVFARLRKMQLLDDTGERPTHPYGWEGIDEHCRAIADEIAEEVVQNELNKYKKLYG